MWMDNYWKREVVEDKDLGTSLINELSKVVITS